MLAYIARRLTWSIPVVFLASFLLFWAVRSTFDPLAKLRLSHDPGVIARETARLGLNQPIVLQYFDWLREFVLGRWGVSSRTGGDVLPLVIGALGPTLQLILWGVLFAAITALAVGVYSAVRRYSFGDHAFTALSYVGIALPSFWFGLLLIQFLGVLPTQVFGLSEPPLFFIGLQSPGQGGFFDYVRHLVLPVLTLTITLVAAWSRFARTSMLDALTSDYVRTAKAKGVPRTRIVVRHALRNSLAPFITVVALDAGLLFGGLIVTEQIFSIPGMGKLFLDSLLVGDVYVLVPWMFIVAVAVIVFNLIADISYAILDPRVKLS